MQFLHLDDKRLKVSLNDAGNGQLKMTVIYPEEPHYLAIVRRALCDILRPEPADKPQVPAHVEAHG